MQNFKEQTPGGVLKHYFEFKIHMSAFCTFNDIIFTSLKKLPLKKNTTINNYNISGHNKCVCYKWNRSWPKDKLKYYLLCLGKQRSVTLCHHFSNVFSLTQYCQLWLCPKYPPPPPPPPQLNWCVCLFVFVCLCLSFAVYNPPDPVPIVAGVLTTAAGIAILVYICIYRTTAEEVQPDEFPQTSTENPDNNASYSPQQLDAKEV